MKEFKAVEMHNNGTIKRMNKFMVATSWVISLSLVAALTVGIVGKAAASNHINYDMQLQQQLRAAEATRQNNLMRQQNEMTRRQNEMQRNIWIQQQQRQRRQIMPEYIYR